jgi:hypothetical protein
MKQPVPNKENVVPEVNGREPTIRGTRFSIKLFIVAFVFTGAVLAWLSWSTYDLYRHDVIVKGQVWRREELRGTIIHLDEVLTMSARMAAVTGDPQWEARYRRFEPQLNQALEEILKLATSQPLAETAAANKRLVAMENHAFSLVRDDHTEEARILLSSQQYEAQKEIYAEGMTRFFRQLQLQLEVAQESEGHRAVFSAGAGIAVLALLLLSWLAIIRRLAGTTNAMTKRMQHKTPHSRPIGSYTPVIRPRSAISPRLAVLSESDKDDFMRQSFWIACCVAMCFGPTSPMFAQEKDVELREQPIQEVFQTGLVYPQERGEVQLSYTSRFSKGKHHSALETLLNFEYGITDRWQVEIEWNAMNRRTEIGEVATRGRGDLSIGTQYSFMNMRRSNFHSAIGFEVTFPTGSVEKELSEGFIEYEPYLIVARDFPKLNNLQIFSQVGVGLVQRVRRRVGADEEEPAAHEFNFNAGMFMPFRRMVFTGEFNLSTNRWNNGGQEREMYLTPGVIWRLPHAWEIGFGVPVGLTRDSDKSGAILRVVYEFSTRRGDEAP